MLKIEFLFITPSHKLVVMDSRNDYELINKNIPSSAERYLINGLSPGTAYKISLSQVFNDERRLMTFEKASENGVDDSFIQARSFSGGFDLSPVNNQESALSRNSVASNSASTVLLTPKKGVKPRLEEVASTSFSISFDTHLSEIACGGFKNYSFTA